MKEEHIQLLEVLVNKYGITLEEAKLRLNKLEREDSEKKKRVEGAQAWLSNLHELIETNDIEFNQYFANMILNISFDIEVASSDKYSFDFRKKMCKKHHTDLAKMVLRLCDKEERGRVNGTEGFISARNWMEDKMYPAMFQVKDFDSADLIKACWDFSDGYTEQIENQSANFSYMVFFGVPVYVFNDGVYDLLDESSEVYGYLKTCGKYHQGFTSREWPAWVDEVFINTEHEKWHYKLDTEMAMSELNIEQQTKLRASYRLMIGVPMQGKDNNTAYGTGSKLSKLVQQVVNRYYSVNFDINDSDTWAKQKDIVEWLMNQHSLSRREAEAIDLVTRPDAARNK